VTPKSSGDSYHKACAVPFRRRNGSVEFCVVSSRRNNDRWTFPKGSVEADETVREAALKEAHEEAGIRGRLVGDSLGAYEIAKYGRALRVAVFLMEVQAEDATWLESDERERRWVGPQEARVLLKSREHRRFLELAVTQLKTS
jgi:8-oxo-dGTP pyrophosphatase MutT (NUDIX family)